MYIGQLISFAHKVERQTFQKYGHSFLRLVQEKVLCVEMTVFVYTLSAHYFCVTVEVAELENCCLISFGEQKLVRAQN